MSPPATLESRLKESKFNGDPRSVIVRNVVAHARGLVFWWRASGCWAAQRALSWTERRARMSAAYRETHLRVIVEEDPSVYVPSLWRLLANPGNLFWLLVGPAYAVYAVFPMLFVLQKLAPSGALFVEAHWRAFAGAAVVVSAFIGALRDAIIERRIIRRSVEQSVEAVRAMQEKGELR